MARRTSISSIFIVFFVISGLISIIGEERAWTTFLPPELLELDLVTRLHFDQDSKRSASTDFGKLTQATPAAVLYPSSDHDIATLLQTSYTSSLPFTVAARGHGHSIRGQAQAHNGVVIEMHSLDNNGSMRINISTTTAPYVFADVGGEQLWIDVLHGTLKHGLTPRSWTDYLYLTVGGTLSNAGVSGQAFRHGPQISNVYEMDVITGGGEMVTCSKHVNSELFYGVLGGLGQFGIITRARIALEPAPQRVKWIRLLYENFSLFTTDQEQLVSSNERQSIGVFDYVEGSVIVHESLINNWRSSSFFSKSDHGRISSLAAQHSTIYCLEVAKYYDNVTASTVDKEVDLMLKGLSQIPGFVFVKDVSYVDFLNRVHKGETKLRAEGSWDVPHPWLNLFVPKSRIIDFDKAVFKGILKQNKTLGLILVYPVNKNRWDDRTSVAIPNEEIFYSVGLLQSTAQGWENLEHQNKEILSFCSKTDVEIKQYLPHYQTMTEWKKHFGPKWDVFLKRKKLFDPKAVLSPGQKIFTPLVGTFLRYVS